LLPAPERQRFNGGRRCGGNFFLLVVTETKFGHDAAKNSHIVSFEDD
jgi:hypothetical protein